MSLYKKNIVILGGGPAGLALAAGLCSKQENCVSLIEKSSYKDFIPGEHVQSKILTCFDILNIPKSILHQNSTYCYGITGSWANKPILSRGIYNPYGLDFILHRPDFEKGLISYLKSQGVFFLLNAQSIKLEARTISINNDIKINYDIIFDCTGRTSRNYKDKRLIFDKLIGISFYDTSVCNENSEIRIESTENGWWYYTSSKLMTITTFFTDSDIYQSIGKNIEKEFCQTIIKKKYGIELLNKPIIKPCYTSILKSQPEGIYQIGDSFYSMDPLSSQGIYKAFNQACNIINIITTNFEETVGNFYRDLNKSFLFYLKIRKQYYDLAFLYHNSEFYRRRILNY